MTSDLTSEDTGWPRAFKFGEGCRFCADAVPDFGTGPRLGDGGNITFGSIKAVDGTYEMLAHQWWCPVLNPNPPLDI